MTELLRSLNDKPYESHYLFEQIILEHSLQNVWDQVIRIGEWMSAHGLETLAGEPGTVGHFVRVHPKELGPEYGHPRYHLYGVAHIIPLQYIALEVLPENGGSYGRTRPWMSFDGLLLTDLGQQTQLTFLMIDTQLGRGPSSEYAIRAKELEDARALIRQYFGNLQALLEKRTPTDCGA